MAAADSSGFGDSPAWANCVESDAARWTLVVCQALAAGSCIQDPEAMPKLLRSESKAANFLNLISGISSGYRGYRRTCCQDFSATLRNILGPFYVKLVSESLQEAGHFSLHLAIPFTQHKDHQARLAVALQCVNHRQEKMETLPLGLFEIESLSGQHVYEGVERVMDLLHLSWENLLGVSISGDRLEESSKEHLVALLREKTPQMVVIPRLCRVLSSSVSSAVSTYLGEDLLVTLKNVFKYFRSWRSLDEFVAFCKSKGAAPEKVRLDVEKLKDPIITKDGYIYQTLKVLSAYHFNAWEFFTPQVHKETRFIVEHPDPKQVSDFLVNNENVCHLMVLNDVLKTVFEVVEQVEKNQLGLLDLGKAVKEIIRGLMEHVIPAGDSNVPLVLPDDLLSATHYDPDLKTFYNEEQSAAAIARGQKLIWLEFFLEKTTLLDDFMEKYEFMRRLNEFGLVRKGVLWRCRKVVLQLIHDLQNKFRDVLDLLDLLETMKPTNLSSPNVLDEYCKGNIQKVVEVLHGPFVDPDFVDKLAAEVSALHHYRAGSDVDAVSRQKPEIFWFEVKEIMDGTIVDLPKLALDVLTLPHCGGSAEYAMNLLEVFQMKLNDPNHRMSLIMLNARLLMDAANKFCGTHNTGDKPFPKDIVDSFLKGKHSTASQAPSANVGLLLTPSAEKNGSGDGLCVPPNDAPWTEISVISAKESLKVAVATSLPTLDLAGEEWLLYDLVMRSQSEEDEYAGAAAGVGFYDYDDSYQYYDSSDGY